MRAFFGVFLGATDCGFGVITGGPALSAKAPPQQRPVSIWPSCVKRNTGLLCSFASRKASVMLLAQPIWSNVRSALLGSNLRTLACTHETSFWSDTAPLHTAANE